MNFLDRRKDLKRLSNEALKLRTEKIESAKSEDLKTFWRTRSINYILIHQIYNLNGEGEFKTFEEWTKEGYTIIKGSSAFVIWGQPVEVVKKFEKIRYCPLKYLFSDKQVYRYQESQEPTTTNTANKKQFETINLDLIL
jgi:hypothetical protein